MSTDSIFHPIHLNTPEEVEDFIKAWEESEKDCREDVPVSSTVLRTQEEVNEFFNRQEAVAQELAREKEHHFGIQVRWIEGLQEYFARVPAYPDFEVHGKTLKEAVDKAQSGIEAWIDKQKAAGKEPVPIPPEETDRECHYNLRITWSDFDQHFIVSVPALAGCMSDGETLEEAIKNTKEVVRVWLESQRQDVKEGLIRPVDSYTKQEQEYNKTHFGVNIMYDDEDQVYLVGIPEFTDCFARGDTLDEAVKNAEFAVSFWIPTDASDFAENETEAAVLKAKAHNHYGVWIEHNDKDQCYFAMIPDIPDCVAGGGSPEEALDELNNAEDILLERYVKNGENIPKATKTDFVRKLYVRNDPDVIANTSNFEANYLYPAVFQREGTAYNVRFPDFDECCTCGDDIKDAFFMAEDALAFVIVDKVKANEELPEPSRIEDIKLSSDEEVHYIFTDLHAYLRNTCDKEADEDGR